MLSWTLALGFGISYRLQAAALDREPTREWLRWLDRIQKSVCARYIGEPVTAFVHDRSGATTVEDDGIIRATYGPVRIIANLGPIARPGETLPPYGYRAEGPGLMAGDIPTGAASFVAEGDAQHAEVWVYSNADQSVQVQLPVSTPGGIWPVSVTWDDGPAASVTAHARSLPLHLPVGAPGTKRLWHAVLRPNAE